jgi:hypothetical protein
MQFDGEWKRPIPLKGNVMRIMLLLLLLACSQVTWSQSMKLALEGDEWKDVLEYPVSGRQGILIKQKLSFGEYHTLMVDRSWTKGSSSYSGLTQGIPTDAEFRTILANKHVKKSQTIYFELADSLGNLAKVYCATNFNSKNLVIGDNPNSLLNIFGDLLGVGDASSNIFYGMIYDRQGGNRWELILDNKQAQSSPGMNAGYLARSKDVYYSIKPLSRLISKKGRVGTMPFGSAGFEIRTREGIAVAAVSRMDKGIVYLTKVSPEEKILLAGVCAALLLQEQI